MVKVFIDGSAGTTGLRINERLQERNDISLITLTEELRKDISARKEALNSADVAFLCLPDAAAIEAVSLVESSKVAIIDTSTAHRTLQGWDYGFAELKGRREKIQNSKRVANPGCHASGFIALVEPLVKCGLIKKDAKLLVRENILTTDKDVAITFFHVDLDGDGSRVEVVSRAVAKDKSKQEFNSEIVGNSECFGHVECDGILADKAEIASTPKILAKNPNANLVHEAAIGKISEEQQNKLMSLGLSKEEAEKVIIEGFLK